MCVRACVRACVHACVRACVCVCVCEGERDACVQVLCCRHFSAAVAAVALTNVSRRSRELPIIVLIKNIGVQRYHRNFGNVHACT